MPFKPEDTSQQSPPVPSQGIRRDTTAEEARHTGVGKTAKELKPGQFLILEGVIENRRPVAIGGEAPPSGSWLLLSSPLHIGKFLTREVYLLHKLLPAGTKALLHGRLVIREYGGVETPRQVYAAISGISDLGADEPFFDGKQFWSREIDEPLQMLVIGEAHLVDAPSRLLVIEDVRQIAHVGTWGGLLPASEGPFQGFYAKAAIEPPSQADQAAIRFDAQRKPVDVATGEPLREIGLRGPEMPHPDAMYTAYYWNEPTETVYVMLNGGIAGFQNYIQWVIHVPRRGT
jgi:hypothetical protein